jgi:hypothetical protein
MKKLAFENTNFTLPSDLKMQIKKSNTAPTQVEIDEAQNNRLADIDKTNRAQDKQLLLSVVLGITYLIWLSALTGWMLYK